VVEVKVGRRWLEPPFTVFVPDATEEHLARLADDETKAELLDGVMVLHSPISVALDDLSGFLRALLSLYADCRHAGNVLGPRSLARLTPGRLLAPTAYFMRRERVPSRRTQYFEGAPDLVLEVLHSANRRFNLEGKRPAYREAGVAELWFVDPDGRRVTIDRRRRGRYEEEVVTQGRATSTVLRGFWVEVSWLWSRPFPDELDCLDEILGRQ
jgi:Uma2 family endonuclease